MKLINQKKQKYMHNKVKGNHNKFMELQLSNQKANSEKENKIYI